MFASYNDKGKIFTEVIQKHPVPVIIQTADHQIRGTIHVRPQVRFKDEIDQAERFIAVTSAEVYTKDSQEVLFSTQFMLVQSSHIVWLFPLEELNSPEQSE